MEKQIMLDDMIKSMERSIKWRENAVAEQVKDIYDAVFWRKEHYGENAEIDFDPQNLYNKAESLLASIKDLLKEQAKLEGFNEAVKIVAKEEQQG